MQFVRDLGAMTQHQLRDIAEEDPNSVIVTIMVTPEEAGILLLADGVRPGIGVAKIDGLTMDTLRRLGFIENIGTRTGRNARHKFTHEAGTRLRFAVREQDYTWINLEEDRKGLSSRQWHHDLVRIADQQATVAFESYNAEQANWLARRRQK